MNRRTFLSALLRGTVATAVAISVPTAVLKTVGLGPATERFALDRLHRLFNTYYATHRRLPTHITLGRQFFEAIEEELAVLQRFTWSDFPNSLAFKGTRVTRLGPGWEVVFS